MKKFVKKEELEYKQGYLVHDNVVVMPSHEVVVQANELAAQAEVLAFVLEHEEEINKASELYEMPKFKSTIGKPSVYLKAETKKLDEYTENIKDIIKEIKDKTTVEKANVQLDQFAELIEFAQADEILVDDCPDGYKFVDDPLGLTEDQISEIIIRMVQYAKEIQAVTA